MSSADREGDVLMAGATSTMTYMLTDTGSESDATPWAGRQARGRRSRSASCDVPFSMMDRRREPASQRLSFMFEHNDLINAMRAQKSKTRLGLTNLHSPWSRVDDQSPQEGAGRARASSDGEVLLRDGLSEGSTTASPSSMHPSEAITTASGVPNDALRQEAVASTKPEPERSGADDEADAEPSQSERLGADDEPKPREQRRRGTVPSGPFPGIGRFPLRRSSTGPLRSRAWSLADELHDAALQADSDGAEGDARSAAGSACGSGSEDFNVNDGGREDARASRQLVESLQRELCEERRVRQRLQAENETLSKKLKACKGTLRRLSKELDIFTGSALGRGAGEAAGGGPPQRPPAPTPPAAVAGGASSAPAAGARWRGAVSKLARRPPSLPASRGGDPLLKHAQVTGELPAPGFDIAGEEKRSPSLLDVGSEAMTSFRGVVTKLLQGVWADEGIPRVEFSPNPLSDNLELLRDRRTVRFAQVDDEEGMCAFACTSAPVLRDDGYGFEVVVRTARLAAKNEFGIGFTARPPSEWPAELPSSADQLGKDTWLVGFSGEAWSGSWGRWIQVPWRVPQIKDGDRIAVYGIFGSGELELLVNGDSIGSIPMPMVGRDRPLWGVVDLLGLEGCIDEVMLPDR